jgi:hypothetical protein
VPGDRPPRPDQRRPDGPGLLLREGRAEIQCNPGFADVWKGGFFGWEYKKKRKNLNEALSRCAQAGQRMRAVIPSFDLT